MLSGSGTHIGVVSFSDEANTELQFTDKQEVTKIKASVLAINYRNGGTRTDKGLLECRLSLFSGTRVNVPRVLLVITDGRSDRSELLLLILHLLLFCLFAYLFFTFRFLRSRSGRKGGGEG